MHTHTTCYCLLLLLLSVGGCGGTVPVGEVSGRVTVADQPLGDASIVFESPDSMISVSANLAPDGSFEMRTVAQDGLPVGDYLVSVRPGMIGTGETPLAGSAPETSPHAAPAIPLKYHRGESSGLTATVSEGSNAPFEFSLNP